MASLKERPADRVVLVVDDESIVRTVMERALAQAGLRVLLATNGKEAQSILESGAPQIWIVVSDLVMPVMDGLELWAAMEKRWPAIPFLLVSGSPPQHFDGPFLRKPFTPVELVSAVEVLLPPAEPEGDSG
jgi:CheY-like chemotaxis protein